MTSKPVKVIYEDYNPTQAERYSRAQELLLEVLESPEEWDIEDVSSILNWVIFQPWKMPAGYGNQAN